MKKLNLISFGKKYRETIDANYFIDARVFKNPFYVVELKEKTGLTKEIQEYILNDELSKKALVKILVDLNEYLKNVDLEEITIGIFCTGGMHRSVALTMFLSNYYKDQYDITINHKDICEKA